MKKSPKAAQLIRQALEEDLHQRGDVTTDFFIPRSTRLSGRVVAKEDGVLCGVQIARAVFLKASPGCRVQILARDGARVKKGKVVMRVSGNRTLLSAERTALNFLQRLSGVATLTALYADKVRGTRAKIFDTRKTLPGWRVLDKYAVSCGGGSNHRMGLYDAVLLKDNHWSYGGDISRSVQALRKKYPKMVLEIEAADLRQTERALNLGADIILLDNMSLPLLRQALRLIRRRDPRTQIEISGGVSLANVRSLARLGADRISIGRITHSAPALDLSLEMP